VGGGGYAEGCVDQPDGHGVGGGGGTGGEPGPGRLLPPQGAAGGRVTLPTCTLPTRSLCS
jgi:hypothetical protein